MDNPAAKELMPTSSVGSRRGVTLIEMIIVVAIIGLFIALVGPKLWSHVDTAKITKARVEIEGLQNALGTYKLDNGNFPTTEQGLQALVVKPTSGAIPQNWKPYLDKLPNDPWSHEYQYANPGLKGEIDIYSLGADGVLGGEGKNADIGSWQ